MRISELPLLLRRLRAGPQAWTEVTCAFEGAGETFRDASAQARRAALAALQYDRQPEDRALIVHLLEQELLAHTQSPFGGLDDGLRLAVFLAATLDDVALAWVMLAVKQANFDTRCGFELEALFFGGVERTWAMVLASDRPERAAFLALAADADGKPLCTTEDVDRWWEQQRRDYPARLQDESVDAQLDLCVGIGDLAAGSEILRSALVRELAAVKPGTVAERRLLENARRRWRELECLEEAARIQTRLDSLLPTEPWERASALSRAIETYTAAGRAAGSAANWAAGLAADWAAGLAADWAAGLAANWIDHGLAHLAPLREALGQVPRWQDVGLGRNAAVIAVDLALAARDDENKASLAFDWSERLIKDGIGVTLLLLEKLHQAATQLGRRERALHYSRLAEAERVRIAAIR